MAKGVKYTAEYLETELKTVTGLDLVVVGSYDLEDIMGNVNTAATIAPITEETDMDLSDGEEIKAAGMHVPWHITIGASGDRSPATFQVLELVDLIKAKLAKDLTQGGTCIESSWAKPRVIYEANDLEQGGSISAARIILMTYYAD